ncbi:MAG: MarR family transcriptional regulator [Armatimonadetes bacterium]|nr:MarR family transcriptional regulator [Armatimonadota bacterium]
MQKNGKPQLTHHQKESFHALLLAHARIVREIDRCLAEKGHVTIDVYDILVTLEYVEGQKMRLNELAEKISFSKSGLSRKLDKLEDQGLVMREPCPNDKRGYYAVLTKKGYEARLSAWPALHDCMHDYWGEFVDDKDAADLRELFGKLIEKTGGTAI